MQWLEVLAWILVVILAIPLSVLAVECFAALGRWKVTLLPDTKTRPRTVILIPAHDEEMGIARTLLSAMPQLGPADRILVVADNCTDGTASIARSHGAEVVERFDTSRRGKGYALAFGRDTLRSDPPEIVIILDADCTLGEHCLHRLAAEAVARQRPTQATYLMTAPPQAGPDRRVAAFAFLVKNLVRPLGLRRLGLPCLLNGTGMAFPWDVIRDTSLGHGHIVEDFGLAIDLAMNGKTVFFVPEAEVRGEFPVSEKAAQSQRKRWEHGQLSEMIKSMPKLLAAGIFCGRIQLVALAFEVSVPPLSALVLVTATVLAALLALRFAGGPWEPAVALAGIGALVSLGLASAWWQFGRSTLPAGTLLRIPLYVVKKITLYLSFLVKPQRDWIRTTRELPTDKM